MQTDLLFAHKYIGIDLNVEVCESNVDKIRRISAKENNTQGPT